MTNLFFGSRLAVTGFNDLREHQPEAREVIRRLYHADGSPFKDQKEPDNVVLHMHCERKPPAKKGAEADEFVHFSIYSEDAPEDARAAAAGEASTLALNLAGVFESKCRVQLDHVISEVTRNVLEFRQNLAAGKLMQEQMRAFIRQGNGHAQIGRA